MNQDRAPYLQFDHIGKAFPGVRALHDVSFGVSCGSVHALMGENGAGKSTLLKILSGVYQPSAGGVRIDGQARQFSGTADALRAGIAVIYQELQLVPQLSVAENLFLGNLPNRAGWVQRSALLEKSAELLKQLGESIDPRTKLGQLPIGQRQMVEIAKALARNATIIAFDEPTSSLSSRETERLFHVIGQLKAAGKAILYVSHRMDEIYALCDTATVLRDGGHVRTYEALQNVTRDELVRAMVGRSISDVFHYTPREAGDVRLRVNQLMGPGLQEPVSLEVRAGEILGLFGLVGAGRSELMKLIFGAVPATQGSVVVDGASLSVQHPSQAIRGGIVLVPEDRKKEGIVGVASVMENINLSGRRHFSPLRFFIRESSERANAQKHVDRLRVKTPSLLQRIVHLSGGNQQKAILGRWLSEQVKVILLDEPTRGIDVGAKSEIYSIIYELASSGIAVVVVSSELPEVLGICDRMAVMRQGRLVGDFLRAQATQENLLQLALPQEQEVHA